MYDLTEQAKRVLHALENPRYDWRTLKGIAAETNLPEDEVSAIVDTLGSQVGIVSKIDRQNRRLFTTRDHYRTKRSTLDSLLSALSDRIR
jgi:hypothetical protein